jgi:alkaline phosphatase
MDFHDKAKGEHTSTGKHIDATPESLAAHARKNVEPLFNQEPAGSLDVPNVGLPFGGGNPQDHPDAEVENFGGRADVRSGSQDQGRDNEYTSRSKRD